MPFICWRILSPTSIHNGPPRHGGPPCPPREEDIKFYCYTIFIFIPWITWTGKATFGPASTTTGMGAVADGSGWKITKQ